MSINQTPSHWYVNFTTNLVTHQDIPKKIRYVDFPSEYGAIFSGNTLDKDFQVTLKAVPRYLTRDYNWTYQFKVPNSDIDEYWIRFSTDLLLSISKGNVNILDRYPVYTDIRNSTERVTNYTIDLFNPAYGLVQQDIDYKNPSTSKYNKSISSPVTSGFMVGSTVVSGFFNSTGNVSIPVTLHPLSVNGLDTSDRYMGRLEYSSNNVYYRTQQQFVYQMGGIYVNQTEGSSPLNLPLITIKQIDSGSLSVDITDVSLNGETTIGGSSPVQIQTTLKNIRGSPLDISQPNTATVVLTVENTNLTDLWKLIFKSIKNNANVDNSWITITGDQNSVSMIITGPSSSANIRDIKLTVTYVDYNVELDAVGKTTGITGI